LGEAQRQTPWTTELEGIRAPLGVILYLIRRDNLDIYDIPIAKITREYLDYLNLMEGMQIDLAGEFFVLAATLMRIKIQMLLRKDDDTDEDPRQELVQSILEYKKMVEAAKSFKDLEDERMRVFTRPVPQEEKDAVTGEVVIDLNLFQLMPSRSQHSSKARKCAKSSWKRIPSRKRSTWCARRWKRASRPCSPTCSRARARGSKSS
jgi:segregation and condensation protein A